MTIEILQQKLKELDNGRLTKGSHRAGSREFCVLEFDAALRGRRHSDQPVTLPDFRLLNDGPWLSDKERTEAMLSLMVAYWDWSTWSAERQYRIIQRVVISTVREIIAPLPILPSNIAESCRSVRTMCEARDAASAANDAAYAVTYATNSAVDAVTYAVDAANAATTNAAACAATAAACAATAAACAAKVTNAALQTACVLWIKAVEDEAAKESS